MANSITFYPTLTDELKDQASVNVKPFALSYKNDGIYSPLVTKGGGKKRVEDPKQIWKAETHGLRVCLSVMIERSDYLYGPKGIICKDAEYGLCLIWKNNALSQMGYIMPRRRGGDIERYDFDHLFKPGEIKDDLTFELIIYVKNAAKTVRKGEEALMNEEGVVVGDLGVTEFAFSDDSMSFPIMEIEDGSIPLWWLELSDWSDPKTDSFDMNHVCLYINTAHRGYQSSGLSSFEGDMLVEIITCCYLMLFQEVESRGCLNDVLQKIDLEAGSIGKVLYYFAKGCDPKLRTESPVAMHDSIHINVEKLLKGGEQDAI